MEALVWFREMMHGLYKMLNEVRLDIFGVSTTLWELYLYGLFASLAVFVYIKFKR